MLRFFLNTIQKGALALRSNTRLLLIAFLVFILPLLFVWVTQSFFETAYSNIATSEKNQVRILHDTITMVLNTQTDGAVINEHLARLTKDYSNLNKVRVVTDDDDGFLVLYANSPDNIGLHERSDELYRSLPLSASESSFIYETTLNGKRLWQTFRRVEMLDKTVIIFSEYDFSVVDSVMSARRQNSYFGLTAVFLFLISLAYWLSRQTDWEKRTTSLKQEMLQRDMFNNLIAHEIRTPITVIKGYASFLSEDIQLTPESKQYVQNISASSNRLLKLVNDFLEVARLQSGKLAVSKERCNLYDVVDQVVRDLSEQAREKNLSLQHSDLPKSLYLNTDPTRLSQVMTNLITNSIKYTNQGGVTVECETGRAGVLITIKDTGIGISAEDQKKLFTPFTRVGDSEQLSITGTGLGMWITQEIIKLLDGEVSLESIKGIGTHIKIRFPVSIIASAS